MSQPEASEPAKKAPSFFAWFPWEKITIWGIFLILVYVLRSFFTIIFLTFIFSYIMTNVVRSTMRVISPNQDRPWLYRGLVVVAFALLIGALTGLGSFLKEPFQKQVEGLVENVRKALNNPQAHYDDLLLKTIGTWRFEALYGDAEGKKRLERDLEEFKEKKFPKVAPKVFQETAGRIKNDFQAWYKDRMGAQRLRELEESGKFQKEFEDWIIASIAARRYENEKDLWIIRFESNPNFADLRLQPDILEKVRYEWIINEIKKEEMVPARKTQHRADFLDQLGDFAYQDLIAESQSVFKNDIFRGYYEGRLSGPDRPAYDYQNFIELNDAVEESPEKYMQVLMGGLSKEDLDKKNRENFEEQKKDELVQAVIEGFPFLRWEYIKEQIGAGEWVPKAAGYLTRWGFYLFQFTIWFALSLLLSFFIAFDLPRIKKGIQKLEESRARELYHEIAPGLAAFGALIGRAFQAQGVIAICNTILTFALIRGLEYFYGEIPFQIFLCTIVFLCSFIPVLGVVISSVPLALVLIQYHGIFAAIYAVLGILAIHFIETSMLNPKILGDMLHLHPVLVLGILVVGEHFFGVWGLLLGVPVMVYILRYVILGEVDVLPKAVSTAVLKMTGVAPPPRDKTPAPPLERAARG